MVLNWLSILAITQIAQVCSKCAETLLQTSGHEIRKDVKNKIQIMFGDEVLCSPFWNTRLLKNDNESLMEMKVSIFFYTGSSESEVHV